MSRFRRLSIDEAKETFPLINEEARKALKGGCAECDNWRILYPDVVIHSWSEYEEMSKNGTWTTGAVCGEGLMVGPLTTVTLYQNGDHPCPIHPQASNWIDCEYCYFDEQQHCNTHNTYFGNFESCYSCYQDQNGYNHVTENNNNNPTTTDNNNTTEHNNDSMTRPLVGQIIANTIFFNSPFEQECFFNYWERKGDMELRKSDFDKLTQIANNTEVNYKDGTQITIEGETYYKINVSFYSDSNYDWAIGTGTMYYDENGNAVGFKDKYNFDRKKAGERNWFAEKATQIMGWIETYSESDAYDIYYGIHD